MPMSREVVMVVGILIMTLVSLAVFFLLTGQLTSGKVVRALVCGVLFWLPFGALGLGFTQACAAIPI